MRHRPSLLEVAWGASKSKKYGWCVLVGYGGRWELYSQGHKTKAECMKAVTKASKTLAGHPVLMAALQSILPSVKATSQ